MNILTIVMAIVLIGTLFVTDLCNMLMTVEMVLIMMLALPIYLYKKKQPAIWNSYLFVMTLSIASRFLTSIYVVSHAKVVQYPIQIANENIRQFAGIGMIVVWLIWYILVLISTFFDNHIIIKNTYTVEKLSMEVRDGTICINKNFCNMTAFMLCINFILSIFVYDMRSVYSSILINVLIIIIVSAVWNKYVNEKIKDRISELSNVITDESNIIIVECEDNIKKELKEES